VPGDLSVIGFDDIELAAAIGLTTVRQPLRESGRLGARCCWRRSTTTSSPPREPPPGLPALEVVVRRTVSQPVT
jgi:DNA-binding LacI/PurR family transcriptional regulator